MATTAIHQELVQSLVEYAHSETQQPMRDLEGRVRQRALAFADQLSDQGFSQDEAAERLGISARTLRDWEGKIRQPQPALPRLVGRPIADSGAEQQHEVLQHLADVGPGVSVLALRMQFPGMARAELDELLKSYRTLWRAQHTRALHVLHWLRPGSVWAMDFAEPPSWIDERYPYLLAVRDLASGKQLLWKPVEATTAAVVARELQPLFLAYGAPWVLKSDNGPAFRADPCKCFLAWWGVDPLFSPPHTPSYNGSIEAAIGSLKRCTQHLADRSGHPDLWTSAVVESARRERNTTVRPRRLHGATPDECWDARVPLGAEARSQFRAAVDRYRDEYLQTNGLQPADLLTHWEAAAMDRVALRRALVAHDLLLLTRRSIPAQIVRPKTASKG